MRRWSVERLVDQVRIRVTTSRFPLIKVLTRMSSREVLIAGLMSLLLAAGCAKTPMKPADPPPDEVLVSLPTSDEVTDYEEFIGHTEAVYAVDVRARVNGYLDKVNFNDGDEVEKGTTLFDIDARPYKATFDNTTAMLEQGQARLTRTTADHRRADALLQRNAIGREEYDRIQGDYAESKATIGAAKASLDMAQLNLDWTKVVAPISGLVSRRLVDPGNLIKADDTILTTIVSLDPIYVYFDIDERTVLKIRRLIAEGRVQSRTEAELPVQIALSDEENFPHQGTINFSDNRLDAGTGTLRVRGVVANPRTREGVRTRLFSPNMFVRIRLPIGKPHNSILISEQAIGTDQGRKYVYVVKNAKIKDKKTNKERDGEIVAYQPIKIGSLNRGMRVVDEGLAMGEHVVVTGLQRVRPGKEVVSRLMSDLDKASPANPSGGSPGSTKVTDTAPPTSPKPSAGPLAATPAPAKSAGTTH